MLPTSLVNDLNLIPIFLELRNNAYDHEIRKLKPNPDLHTASLFSFLNPAYKSKLLDLIDHSPHHLPPLIYSQLKRSLGSLCGLAIADSLGHNFEFLPVQDEFLNSYFEYPSSKPGGKIHDPLNQFRLKPGQWTDDASMSLCQADSLLACGGFNGSHTRCYYWNWWNNNVDNAFRYDDSRTNSCGLGGNISQSLGDISHRIEAGTGDFVIPHRYGSFTEDSGNGSLMRLAPIPIRYHQSLQHARQVASLSSLTTHPGSIAAEACAFVSYLVVKCIHLPTPLPSVSQHSPQASSLKSSFLASFHSSSGSSSPSPPSSASSSLSSESNIQDFLTEVINEYIELRDGEERGADGELKSTAEGGGSVGWISLRRLLIGRDNPPTERCWNWREESLNFKSTLEARGRRYNGYPVSPTYFGAYSLDGLAMALHALYHTSSFNLAIVKVINMCGDADSTGAIAAQIAGAYYGVDSIDRVWLRDMRRWDPDREIELRAMLLYFAGLLCDPSPFPADDSACVTGDEEGKGCSTGETPAAEAAPTATSAVESLLFDSFFPEVDTKPIMGPKHPHFTPLPAPSRPFDQPYASSGPSSAKRTLSMFRFFS